jgi:hypothetical protein
MTVNASSVRSSCSAGDGQSMPAGTSFIASPEPRPRNARPGARNSSVAAFCATTTGVYRWTIAVTALPSST